MANAGTLTIYTQVDQSGLNKGIAGITRSMNKLASTMKLALGITGFLTLGKSAIQAASDLQEYQNVADVTFGNLIGKLDKLTEVSIESYGMSKLTATQAASGFMAMGNAAGIAKDQAAEMATTLTAYMGDFASFYNLSHERARTALAAVYTGETETLKQYGIMLQEVNLQQYENEYGMGRSVKTMSAAEKAMLRYNYVMHVGKDAMGDFERTSGNWANQVRVLTEQWKEFMIVLGNGLITILTPVIQFLNRVVLSLINFSHVLGATLTKIFGIQWQDLSEQYNADAESAEDAADAQENLADATSAAAKAAKKSLASWDELNVLQKDAGANSSAELPGLTIDSSIIGDAERTQSVFESIADSMYELGQVIRDRIMGVLDGLNWQALTSKMNNFATGIADYLNGLLSYDGEGKTLFGGIATSFANLLNAVVGSAMTFGQKFDFTQLGKNIGDAINQFFSNIDAEEFANTIDTWVQGLRDTFKAAVDEIDWDTVYSTIITALESLDISTVTIVIGALFIKDIAKAVLGFNLLSWLGKSLTSLVKGKSITVGIDKVIASLTKGTLVESGTFLGNILDVIALVRGGAGTLSEAMVTVFGPTATAISSIVSIVGGALMAIGNFISMLVNGFSWLKEIFMVIGVALAAVGAVIAGIATGPVAAIVAAIVAAVMTIVVLVKDNWNAIVEFCVDLWNSIVSIFSVVVDWINTNIVQPVVSIVTGLVTRISQFFEGLWLIIQAIWIIVSGWFNDNVIQPLVEFFAPIVETVGNFFTGLWEDIKSVWKKVSTWFSETVIEPLQDAWETMTTKVGEFFNKLWTGIKAGVATAVNAVIGAIEGVINKIIDGINWLIGGFNDVATWAAGVVGVEYGGVSLIPKVTLSKIPVPQLASGAVIPPNKEFLAMLGDQKHGTNIEAPLDTIKQALAEVIAANGMNNRPQDAVIEMDGQVLARLSLPYMLDEINRRGYNLSVNGV